MTDTNPLLTKLKQRYNELPVDHPYRDKLKEVIDIIEDEENDCKNKPEEEVEPPAITIDESLLKDAIESWSEMKPVLKEFYN